VTKKFGFAFHNTSPFFGCSLTVTKNRWCNQSGDAYF
jgi:hypothetical protein